MIYIKKLNPNKDIGTKYQSWMNDIKIHKYTEQRYKKHTLEFILNNLRSCC